MVGSLDHPEDWPPTWEHSGIESKVPWCEIHDDLPQTTTEESDLSSNVARCGRIFLSSDKSEGGPRPTLRRTHRMSEPGGGQGPPYVEPTE